MKWLENNPLGVGLICASGGILLLGTIIWFAWSRPVDTEIDPDSVKAPAPPSGPEARWEMGPARDYQVFNDRPLFNETRRPAVIDEVEPEPEVKVVEKKVSKPPDVRLTGVVITPNEKLVTLTPAEGGEPLIVREGMPLEGEYVGWSVDNIDARAVSLRSARGDAHDLDLMVFKKAIKEPPKPKRRMPARDEDEEADEGGGKDQSMSRAEEIRQRIAERREQLREQADQEQANKNNQQAEKVDSYQAAIQSMMQKKQSENREEGRDER